MADSGELSLWDYYATERYGLQAYKCIEERIQVLVDENCPSRPCVSTTQCPQSRQLNQEKALRLQSDCFEV